MNNYNLRLVQSIETDEGRFTMMLFKEKCGQKFKVQFHQETFIMFDKTYEFGENVKMVFKYHDGEFILDPMNVIKTNFTQEVTRRVFNFGFEGDYTKFRVLLQDCIDAVKTETEGNNVGIRN